MTPRRRSPQKAYSMMEIAIVIAVIGIILGALWVAATHAWEYTRREQVRETIATTVANARSYFGGQVGVPAVASSVLTNQMIVANVVPSALKRQTDCGGLACADNPWVSSSDVAKFPDGTFEVCYWSLGIAGIANSASTDCSTAPTQYPSAFFGVEFKGLTKQSCVALVETMSGANQPTGLVEINIGGINLQAGGYSIQPVSDTAVETFCITNAGADGTLSAVFVYRATSATP